MSQQTRKIPGTSPEEEKQTLKEFLGIAEQNLQRTKDNVQRLVDEMHELGEVYDPNDKEGIAQWFNADMRFKQVKQELLRSERTRKKPYFGRIDFTEEGKSYPECFYIGKAVIAKDASEPEVIDWRAPIASVYYEKSLGDCTYQVKGEGAFRINLSRKRTYEIENDELKDFYDSDVVANDELLTKYLARNKRNVLSEIIATIQQEQNEIIRKKPQHNLIVQGSAGSGKTTVAMHRISYILYNYDVEFKPKDFYIIGSNKILLNYITGILPDLDVYGASQMTMEQLFIRLLYEDWDEGKYQVKKLNKSDRRAAIKGSMNWFHDLETFCRKRVWEIIPREDVLMEKNHHRLMSGQEIERIMTEFDYLSRFSLQEKLTEHLMARLENEIYGKYYSYPLEEQKALLRKYPMYFGRPEWKGSIYELYQNFLLEQVSKGYTVDVPDCEFDIYDLASLAYIYKKIKEDQIIQEASHVVIDEAQDFGMMVYASLKYCLSKCTYTIMGDVSQNIYFDYGLTDWEELRGLMLPGEFDYFGLLRKSYRNTVEISNFATNILQHGNFPIYPVEPIIRHGNEVGTYECRDAAALIQKTLEVIAKWKEQNYETIAVICKDDEEAIRVSKELSKHIEVKDFDSETEEFGSGVMVLPIEYSKGLEFDVVLLYNANEASYPSEDGYTRLLYVAATRALHELVVLYTDKITDLIAAPVPEEKRKKYRVEVKKPVIRSMPEEEPKTKMEVELQRAEEGHREMELRNRIGPKRIVVTKPVAKTETTGNRTVIGSKVDYYANAFGMGKDKQEMAKRVPSKRKFSEFGSMPDSTSLRPLGHSTLDNSVKWVQTYKNYVDLTSACGTLRITPISDNTTRITFAKGEIKVNGEVPSEIPVSYGLKWSVKDSREKVEIFLSKMTIRVEKKTGALTFYSSKDKPLLAENQRLPRQLGNQTTLQTWTYFDWTKKEILKARGTTDSDWVELGQTAKYISHGEGSDHPSCLMSNAGYQILTAVGTKTLVCTIPTYGPYFSLEGNNTIDYFFRSAL